MAKLLRCRDLGFDCEGELRADSEEEILAQAAHHAREHHGVEEVSDRLVEDILATIRQET